MIRNAMVDAAGIKLAAQEVTGASAAGVTWIAAAGEWSLALFGVPLSIILCAALGAFGVLSFVDAAATTLRRAMASACSSMMIAAIGTPLMLHAAGGDGRPLPSALGPGMAIVVAVILQLLLPWVANNAAQAMGALWERLLDRVSAGRGSGFRPPPASPRQPTESEKRGDGDAR